MTTIYAYPTVFKQRASRKNRRSLSTGVIIVAAFGACAPMAGELLRLTGLIAGG